jgi:hypothetical protein
MEIVFLLASNAANKMGIGNCGGADNAGQSSGFSGHSAKRRAHRRFWEASDLCPADGSLILSNVRTSPRHRVPGAGSGQRIAGRPLTRRNAGGLPLLCVVVRVVSSYTTASAARLATERRACIPGRRASSVQHGNAAMPEPIKDIALACLPSPPRGFVWTGRNG